MLHHTLTQVHNYWFDEINQHQLKVRYGQGNAFWR